jgi:hypothetical protein
MYYFIKILCLDKGISFAGLASSSEKLIAMRTGRVEAAGDQG